MKARAAVHEKIHSLEIPLASGSLLLPSAAIAEVTNYADIQPIPGCAPWVLGVCGWRNQAVTVVSFEMLLGGEVVAPTPGSKIVVFYPLPGRREWEFFGLISSSEPRPQAIDTQGVVAAEGGELPESRLIGAGLKVADRLLAIPDLEALKSVFYPPAGR